jgi:hypothetical protein
VAHLWVKDDSDHWAILRLGGQFVLLPDALPATGVSSVRERRPDVMLLRSAVGNGGRWLLLADSKAVMVNGVPLVTGVRVLVDQDEISLGPAWSFFFSSEELAIVVEFPGSEKPVFCPRCKLEVASGTKAVKCPGCGVWHHQSDDLPCWAYSRRCTLCDQSTELNGRYRWSPDEL